MLPDYFGELPKLSICIQPNKIIKISDSWNIHIKLDQSTLKFVIHKGSITIDGVSLTINKIIDNIIHLISAHSV